jgi:hypothetical protein
VEKAQHIAPLADGFYVTRALAGNKCTLLGVSIATIDVRLAVHQK